MAESDLPEKKKRKILIPWYGELPGIDEQIRYVRRARKQIYTESRVLRADLRMIHAIEQTLLAAKLFFKTKQ
jgi:hypothetical protein